jgi:hypothetical protein
MGESGGFGVRLNERVLNMVRTPNPDRLINTASLGRGCEYEVLVDKAVMKSQSGFMTGVRAAGACGGASSMKIKTRNSRG